MCRRWPHLISSGIEEANIEYDSIHYQVRRYVKRLGICDGNTRLHFVPCICCYVLQFDAICCCVVPVGAVLLFAGPYVLLFLAK